MEEKKTSTEVAVQQENAALQVAQKKFETAMQNAEALQIVNNYGAAFTAAGVVKMLREALTDEVMRSVFMPLMNTKVGFLTDRTGRQDSKGVARPLYSVDVVRNAIIDAASIGILPTGNQFNIIAERMYPTKEGYTYLLKKINCKYIINTGIDNGSNANFAVIPCKVTYEYGGEKKQLDVVATVKKDSYSSPDQLRGKAERRAKKALYEFLTGFDFGDADEQSSTPDTTKRTVEDAQAVDVTEEEKNKAQKLF